MVLCLTKSHHLLNVQLWTVKKNRPSNYVIDFYFSDTISSNCDDNNMRGVVEGGQCLVFRQNRYEKMYVVVLQILYICNTYIYMYIMRYSNKEIKYLHIKPSITNIISAVNCK